MGSLSVLYNIPALQAEDQLGLTQTALNSTLTALSSGQRINTGADDPAGLAIANGLEANITALTQSVQNATDGVGELQVADGALSQITSLLNSAISLATESSSGTVSDTQRTALQAEFLSVQNEIDAIGSNTTYNGQAIFQGVTPTVVYMSDSSSAGINLITVSFVTVSASSLGLTVANNTLSTASDAQAALLNINSAIQTVAGLRGDLGAESNQLSAAVNVMNVQITNLTNAENSIMAANMGEETSNLSKESILQQTGIAALQESNQLQQNVLKLFQ